MRVEKEGPHFYQLVSLLHPNDIRFFSFNQDKETQDQYKSKEAKKKGPTKKSKKSWRKRKRRNRKKIVRGIKIEEED